MLLYALSAEFGSQLTFHPHIHVIVTGGGLSLDKQRWITTDPKFLMPHLGLKKRWRYNVTVLLRKAHIARLIRHIPDERFPMIRHCGIFANKYKLVAMKVSNKLK